MQAVIIKMIFIPVILFFSVTISAQDLCSFILRVQDYQDSVKIKFNGNEDQIDSNTFNLNTYLNYFDKLSVQLDQKVGIYYFDNFLDGKPYLYAIKKSQTFDRVIDSLTSHKVIIENRRVKLKKNHAIFWYINNEKAKNILIPEDSELGFLQYLFFNVMGEQFALKWHSNYDEKYIICDHDQLVNLRDRLGDQKSYSEMRTSDQEVEIELEPFTVDRTELEILINHPAQINITHNPDFYYITWLENRTHSGIYECTYKIDRNKPYRIETISENLLLHIYINFIY